MLIIIILSLLCAILLTWHLVYRLQIQKLGTELNEILQDEPTNRLLRQEVTSQEVTLLVSSVNQLLNQNRLHARLYRQEADKLQQSLTHLAHDLRTPLAGMEGYLQLWNERTTEEEQTRYREILQGRMKHTRYLMDQYFLSLKYESEQAELPLSPIDPNELFLKCLLSLAAQFDEKNIKPTLNLLAESVSIEAHEESLFRLYQNLIQNALIHGERFIDIETQVADQQFLLVLKNGLNPNQKPDPDRVFDRFYKGDPMRTVESTGLGLSIVKSLTHHLKGQIQVELAEDSFIVRLRFPLSRDSF